MKRNVFILLSALLALTGCVKGYYVTSPDGNISVGVTDSLLTVLYKGRAVQVISCGYSGKISMSADGIVTGTETYDLQSGKCRTVSAPYSACTFNFTEGTAMNLHVFNDGIAFSFTGGDRTVTYRIPDGTKRWLQQQKTDYEGFYPASTSAREGKYSYPALFEYCDGVFGLITESGVDHGNSCSFLTCGNDGYTVTYTDSEQTDRHPSRILMIGSLADIVESNLVTTMAAACRIDDTSWIRPGVSSWIYWAYNHSSKDFQKVREYIDLAAEMGWPYTLIDWEWDEMTGGGNIDDAVAYARGKGVRANLWYNSGTSWIGPGAPGPQDRLRTAEAREREMTRLEQMGATGIKVDFFNPDGHEMVDYYLDILEDAARHHLLVDFHGCTIPRGWSRTWPNLMSMEAVYGAEWYNNNRRMTNAAAAHNATLPFTRNVIGPMDYTPCTFTDSQNPHITTDCHELALPILFESGLQHMADRPEAYLGLPALVRNMLSSLPSAWEDTKLLAGYPGESAVIARYSKGKWYIAGINGTDSTLTVRPDYSRLGVLDELDATVFTDKGEGPGKGFEIGLSMTGCPSSLTLRPRGGFVIVTSPKWQNGVILK